MGALPLNGGAYNVLLNTTSKSNAAIAACLTILSYMATAVISSSEAMHYLHTLIPSVPVLGSTILLLLLFLLLTIAGLSESALIATIIFVIHLSTIAILILSGIWFVTVSYTHLDVYKRQLLEVVKDIGSCYYIATR